MGGIGGGGGARSGNVDGIDNFSNQLSTTVILLCGYRVHNQNQSISMLIHKSEHFEKLIFKCVFKISVYRSLHFQYFKSVYDF